MLKPITIHYKAAEKMSKQYFMKEKQTTQFFSTLMLHKHPLYTYHTLLFLYFTHCDGMGYGVGG